MGYYEECYYNLSPESLENIFSHYEKLAPTDKDKLIHYKKMKLAAEVVMSIWAEKLGENTTCHTIFKSRFGRETIECRVPGIRINPFEENNEMLTLSVNGVSIFTRLQVIPEYHYVDGFNILKIWIPKKRSWGIVPTLMAIVLALLLGLGLKRFSPDLAENLSEYVFSPALSLLSRCLSALSGPLVFLALTTGIIGLGDMQSFKKTGGILMIAFFVVDIISEIITFGLSLPFIQIESASVAKGSSSIGEIIDMIVEIVPNDIVTPFATGNTIQLIVLAFAFSLGIIYLGNSVPYLQDLPFQLQDLINVLLSGFSRFLPLFVFLSIITLLITSESNIMLNFVSIFSLTVISCILLELLQLGILKIRDKACIRDILKCQMKYVMIASATASSYAVIPMCLDICKKDFKLDSNLTNIGMSLGTLVSKPPMSSLLLAIALIFSKDSGIAITTASITLTMFVSVILSVSSPPLPGVGSTMVMLLFSQLGIPDTNIGLAIGIAMIMDYVCTGFKMLMIPQQLMIVAPLFSD